METHTCNSRVTWKDRVNITNQKNTNQNYDEILPSTSQGEKTEVSVGKNVEKWKPLCAIDGSMKWYQTAQAASQKSKMGSAK